MARFQVLGCVGKGGMGQVYAAFDPQLNRKVALKVLHRERDDSETPRLVREAQALARLAHPHVVAVHDVGMHDGRLFVAMEFVEGVTLREWLKEHPPGGVDRLVTALELLIQAGEGLAAAHREGLIHRDFKPSNVLVGNDGRVRVVDFGVVGVDLSVMQTGRQRHLAVVSDEDDVEAEAAEGRGDKEAELLAVQPLTRPGALVGTPAYMAPEQLLATKVTAASDQFGFCLTAWEAIFGVRPFASMKLSTVLEKIRRRRPIRPEDIECPPELETALRKGFAFGPSGRHKNMAALLEVLRTTRAQLQGKTAPPPPPTRRWPWVGALALTTATALGAFALGRSDSQACTGADARLAGVWDVHTKATLEPAFLRTEARFAPDAWQRFEHTLDDYTAAWVAGHRDACEAAQVRKEQSPALMDQRMACLEDRRRELVALTEVYADPDAEMLAHSDEALAELASVGACADPEYVQHHGAVPEAAEQAAPLEALRQHLARSSVLETAGRDAEALALADEAIATADDLGMPGPQARTYLRRGKVHTRLRQGERARNDLEQAVLLAKSAALPEVEFEASRILIQVNAILMHDRSMAGWWARAARHGSREIHDPADLARFHVDLGSMHRAQGQLDTAAEHYTKAVDLLEQSVGPDALSHAGALRALGELQLLQGGPDLALPSLERARAAAERALGTNHPSMARFHTSIARAHRFGGDLDRSLEQVQRALTLSEEAYGANHVALHAVLEERSHILEDRGEVEAAIEQLERARALHVPEPAADAVRARLFAREGEIRFQQHAFDRAAEVYRKAVSLASATLGDVHPHTARYRIGLGSALGGLGRRGEATALIEAGLAVREAALGGQHPNVASTYDTLAAEMERVGDLDKALDYTQRALRITEAAYGEGSLPIMRAHGNMCAVLGRLGRAEAAAEHCKTALALAEAAVSLDPQLIAGLHNNLGAALANAQRYEEAVSHYHSARELWERQLGPENISVAIVLANLGEVALARGRGGDAHALYAQSLAIRERRLGLDHPMVVVPLVGMARARVQRGKLEEAVALARRAVEVSGDGRTSPLLRARAQEALARALWSMPGCLPEAQRLAEETAEIFARAGVSARADRKRLAGWWPGTADQPTRPQAQRQ